MAELALLRDELEDRFGPIPPPLENLIALQQARIKLGEAGARAVSFRGGRLAVTPIDLDAERAKRLRGATALNRSTSRASRSSRCEFPTIRSIAFPQSCMRQMPFLP